MRAPVAFFGLLHVPPGDHPYHPASLPFEDDDQESPRACSAERRVVTPFRLSNERVQRQHLLGFLWFDPVSEGEMKRIAIIPFEAFEAHA